MQIYLGNADIGLYAPGPDSFIDAKDYRTADELAKVVQRIAKLKEPYAVRAWL